MILFQVLRLVDLYIIKNNEGETVAKDLNQNQLASRYPEMAEKLEG